MIFWNLLKYVMLSLELTDPTFISISNIHVDNVWYHLAYFTGECGKDGNEVEISDNRIIVQQGFDLCPVSTYLSSYWFLNCLEVQSPLLHPDCSLRRRDETFVVCLCFKCESQLHILIQNCLLQTWLINWILINCRDDSGKSVKLCPANIINSCN